MRLIPKLSNCPPISIHLVLLTRLGGLGVRVPGIVLELISCDIS
jgi:hypothetical protein